MKHTLLIALLMLLLSPLSAMGSSRFDSVEQDLGTINEWDGIITTTFKLTNSGKEAITITNIAKSCGCTSVNYPHAPIPAGEVAIIEVSYNPTGEIGAFKQSIRVSTTDSPKPKRLQISGTVIPTTSTLNSHYPISIGDLRVRNTTYLLGEVNRGSNIRGYISLYNSSEKPLKLQFSNLPKHIAIKRGKVRLSAGAKVTIPFTYDANQVNDWGIRRDYITLTSNNITQQLEIIATITEDFSQMSEAERVTAPIISTSTDRLHFKNLNSEVAESDSLKFTITNRGEDELIIHKISTPSLYINSKISTTFVKQGESAQVTISINTSTLNPDESILNEQITVISNDPVTPTKMIHLVGVIDRNCKTP